MTTLGKTIFAALSLAVLVSGTLALRHESKTTDAPAQVAPAQMVASQPAETPLEPPKTVTADAGAIEEEPLPEDSSGS
ncbi:MAG: hypothetical protein ACM3PC_14220 [Deltaproteobacteria bacterium]